MIRENLRYVVVLALLLRGLGGFSGFRLSASVGTLLLRLVMRVRFLVVVAALPTEKEQYFLRVAGTHIDSFHSWRLVVKTMMRTNGC